MKTIPVYLTFLLFSLTIPLYSQLHLNISAGLNNSNVEIEELNNVQTDARFAYFIGLAPSYKLNDKISFQIDAQYSLKGYDLEQGDDLPTLHTRLTYLDFLPEIEYYICDNVVLGIGFNYGIKTNEQAKSGDGDWSNTIRIVDTIDFGLSGKVKFHFDKFFGFVRYNHGLRNTLGDISFTDVNGDAIENVKQLNRNLQVGVGYQISFKKG